MAEIEHIKLENTSIETRLGLSRISYLRSYSYLHQHLYRESMEDILDTSERLSANLITLVCLSLQEEQSDHYKLLLDMVHNQFKIFIHKVNKLHEDSQRLSETKNDESTH